MSGSARLPNPIYQRAARNAGPPPLRQAAALAAVLLAISAASLVLPGEGVRGVLSFVALIALVVLAPVAAGMAALLAASDAQSEGFELQKITLLGRGAVVQGYSLAALYRARLLIALAIGLLPALAGMFRITVQPGDCHLFLPRSAYQAALPPDVDLLCAPDGDVRFLLQPVASVAAMSVPGLVAVPAVLFGVWLGLALRRPVPAIGIAVVAILSLILAYLILVVFRIDKSSVCQTSCLLFHPWPDPLVIFGAAVGVLAALAVGLYAAALRDG